MSQTDQHYLSQDERPQAKAGYADARGSN